MHISGRLRAARVSGTVRLSQLARALAASGRPVIDLAEGESDFDTPAHVVEAAHAAARAGQTRYTDVAGTAALRAAIAARLHKAASGGNSPMYL